MARIGYFDGFAWPVPRAFSDALAKCKFEHGDLLYSEKCAYELQWAQAKEQLSYSIQITSPLRGVGGSTVPGSEGVFNSNWNSDVEFNLIAFKSAERRKVRTLQGNLYKMLRDGDLSYIECSSGLPIPMTVSELNCDLEDFQVEKKRVCQFLLAIDETSEVLTEKQRKIENALDGKFSMSTFSVSALVDYFRRDILPTLKIVVFDIDLGHDDVESKIKEAVYVPVKAKKTERERFRLKDHGVLR